MSDNATRLTGTSFAVLTLIELLGPSTPYELKQALERSIANFWMVPHTTFYAEPTRLVKGGFLSERQETGGRRRKVYSLTDAGRSVLEAWKCSAELTPPQLREEGVLKIFAGADPVPVFRARCDWHRAKLAELEGYLEAVTGEDPAWEGVRASLVVGVAYTRMMLEAMEGFLESQAATGSP
ncbi:MAG TPA: PadR family transcriptional regulator [Solirubrobacteraceae bacterium]|jgi:DNA-binding PadR family transcriptional regulator|nr:PadR family transcriptional regulator [Solirubrobacteraceae bacterium]